VADETEITEASLQRIARENVALLVERDALRAAIGAIAANLEAGKPLLLTRENIAAQLRTALADAAEGDQP
jgi:hypothetical protein